MDKSKLLLPTFDGTMKSCRLTPNYTNTKVEFSIKYYEDNDTLVNATLFFDEVIAVDFAVNYFDNLVGVDLFGFYEIFETEKKVAMIERIFQNRLEGYLYHGDYNYDPNEENDLLNYRNPIEEILQQLNNYCLYQMQTQGGIFYILAKSYQLINK